MAGSGGNTSIIIIYKFKEMGLIKIKFQSDIKKFFRPIISCPTIFLAKIHEKKHLTLLNSF